MSSVPHGPRPSRSPTRTGTFSVKGASTQDIGEKVVPVRRAEPVIKFGSALADEVRVCGGLQPADVPRTETRPGHRENYRAAMSPAPDVRYCRGIAPSRRGTSGRPLRVAKGSRPVFASRYPPASTNFLNSRWSLRTCRSSSPAGYGPRDTDAVAGARHSDQHHARRCRTFRYQRHDTTVRGGHRDLGRCVTGLEMRTR